MRFLDFCKAFNSVKHTNIFAKLAVPGGSSQVVGWVRSFLANRSFLVRIEDFGYEKEPFSSGVTQGYVIDSFLILVMINDLHHNLQLFCWIFTEDTKVRSIVIVFFRSNLIKMMQ